MKNKRTITRKNSITEELKTMTAKAAYREITKTAEGQELCDEWAVEDEEIFENILEGAGTLEIGEYVYSYNGIDKIKIKNSEIIGEYERCRKIVPNIDLQHIRGGFENPNPKIKWILGIKNKTLRFKNNEDCLNYLNNLT